MINSTLPVAALLLLVSGPAYGQPDRPLVKRFDDVIRSMMTDAHPEAMGEEGHKGAFYQRWIVDGRRVTVRHFVVGTPDKAQQFLADAIRGLPVPSKKLEGFGDTAFLVPLPDRFGTLHLNFTRENVIVLVATPGEDNLRRIAARLLEEVDAALKAGEVDGR